MQATTSPITILLKWNAPLPDGTWMHSKNQKRFTNLDEAEYYVAKKLLLLEHTGAFYEMYSNNTLIHFHYQKNATCLKY